MLSQPADRDARPFYQKYIGKFKVRDRRACVSCVNFYDCYTQIHARARARGEHVASM